MILTCPQCQSQYSLVPEKLGAAGKTVRCVSCSHTWFQVAPETSVQSVEQALDKILQQDDAALQAIVSGAKTASAVVDSSPIASRQETDLPVLMHNPFGVGANLFGALAFLLCAFVTLTVVFLAQKPLVRHWPQVSLLYRTLGFELRAPGEGLRVDGLAAMQRIDNGESVVALEGKITNMTEHGLDYPALRVTLKDSKDKPIKEWDLAPGTAEIASGAAAPITLRLAANPEDGSTIDVRVED